MKARKRVLFVGVNREYVNRTFAVLVRAIQANFAVDFFGPGYQPIEVVNAGPDRWVDRNGPYDILLFEHYTICHDEVALRDHPFLGDVTHFDHRNYASTAPALAAFVNRYQGIKCFIANWDSYGLEKRRTDELEALGAYVLDASQNRQTRAEREKHFAGASAQHGGNQRGFWFTGGTDHWVNYRHRNMEHVLEVPHAIGLEQFSYTPHSDRPIIFSVPGTSYSERQALFPLLPASHRFRRFWAKVTDRIYYMSHHSLTARQSHIVQARYDAEIAESRICYTSGSVYRFPVRKYFEIPALGACPIGQTVEGFDELGFRDGDNFIIAETAADVGRVISDYHPDDVQQMAKNAQRLILEQHSEPARARQLAESFSRILEGSFRGSYWQCGQYRHY